VDDIQIIGSNDRDIQILQTGLRSRFTMKDVQPQTHLGLQIKRKGNSLRLHQAPYTRKILESFGFDKAKTVSTPMVDKPLSFYEGEPDEALIGANLQEVSGPLSQHNNRNAAQSQPKRCPFHRRPHHLVHATISCTVQPCQNPHQHLTQN
jgi:hypothetical protein